MNDERSTDFPIFPEEPGWEVGRLGSGEVGRLGGWEVGRLGGWEVGRIFINKKLFFMLKKYLSPSPRHPITLGNSLDPNTSRQFNRSRFSNMRQSPTQLFSQNLEKFGQLQPNKTSRMTRSRYSHPII